MSQIAEVPVVTLRDMVVYPHGVQPLFIGTPKSISALEAAQVEAVRQAEAQLAQVFYNETTGSLASSQRISFSTNNGKNGLENCPPPRPPARGARPPGPPLRASAHGTHGEGT